MKLLYLTSALVAADINDLIVDRYGHKFASKLATHGCHCKKLSGLDYVSTGGVPIDDIDALCRDFFASKSCMHLIGGRCENVDSSQYEDSSGVCIASVSCAAEMCRNNESFLTKLGDYKNKYTKFDSQVQCMASQIQPKSHCCGYFPNLAKYSEEESICLNGQVQDKPQDPIGYVGCVKDKLDRIFKYRAQDFHTLNILDAHDYCIKKCTDAMLGFTYYGLQYARECFCGYDNYDDYGMLPETKCNMKCADDKTLNNIPTYNNNICGGEWAMSIYRFK